MSSMHPYARTLPYGSSRSFDSQIPNVPVPPVDYDYATGNPTMILQTSEHDPVMYRDDKYGSPDFLQRLAATKPGNLGAKVLDWKFDMRRQAQAVIPFLYLGPSTSMRDAAFLKEAGITFLLAVRSSKAVQARPNYLNPATGPAAINRHTATFNTDTPYDFITGINPVIKAVVDYLQAYTTIPFESTDNIQARILVCCETGNDRSATFVAAFLMVIYGLSAREAMQVIHSQRCSVSIDESMRRMLLTLDDIIAAERQVVRAQLAARDNSFSDMVQAPQDKKRNHGIYDMDNDEEMGGSDHSDGDDEVRSGVAPFIDISC